MARLQSVGLVLVDGARYRIKGMDKERAERSASASHAARTRWGNAPRNAGGNAPRNAETMPSQAEPSRDETSQAEQDAQALWYDLKGGQVSERALAFVRDLQEQFGDARLMPAMTAEYEAAGRKVDREFLSRVKGRLLIDGERTHAAAERKRADGELAYQRSLKEGVERMTPEERARADKIKAGIADFLKGSAA